MINDESPCDEGRTPSVQARTSLKPRSLEGLGNPICPECGSRSVDSEVEGRAHSLLSLPELILQIVFESRDELPFFSHSGLAQYNNAPQLFQQYVYQSIIYSFHSACLPEPHWALH